MLMNITPTNVLSWVSIIVNILLLISFYIMVAGFGAYFEQEIGINKIVGSIILDFLCVIIFFLNVKGVLKASNFIVPFLIIIIIFIGIQNIFEIRQIKISQIINISIH